MPPREFPDTTYRGKNTPLMLNMAFADLGSTQIEWIQPEKGRSVYDEFLQRHGDGIHHLAYGMSSFEQLQEQVNYFKSKGVEVIQKGSWKGTKGTGQFVYLNTAPRGGGITMELEYDPDAAPVDPAHTAANDYPLLRDTQFAPVVRDIHKVDGFYQSLGFGGMRIDHNISLDRNYRGQPGKFEMDLGWWRWTEVSYEWIQPTSGPSVYGEYLKKHGEGLHHIAFEVKDMDEAVKLMAVRGATVSMSGAWDIRGSKGRFAYLDAEPHGGVTIELLWNAPGK
jgi:catechol 2,3-dioxygenase-like lactoylglutathione lyase family enzyme